MNYLEEVAEGVVGELREPRVAEGDRGPGVDVEFFADGEVLFKVLAVPNVPEAPLDSFKYFIEVRLFVFMLFSSILVSKSISVRWIPIEK